MPAFYRGAFTEDVYSSRLSFQVNGSAFSGTYAPPLKEDAESGETRGPGKATLQGQVTTGEDGSVVIVGQWRHIGDTPYGHVEDGGAFEMKSGPCAEPRQDLSALGSMEGVWWMGDGEKEKNPWRWNARDIADVQRWSKRFVTSVNMERFGMACAWLFFIQTAMQLLAILPDEKWSINDPMNTAFNVDYSILYAAFLLAYVELGSKLRPHWTYTSGVFLYFLGYVLFACLYAGAGGGAGLYHGGSWLFLVGSVLLMYATRCDNYNPLRKGSALFWGSTCFFLGSVMFAIDAASLGNPRANSIIGLVLFVLGRLFFVRGSQTARCGVFFQSQEPVFG